MRHPLLFASAFVIVALQSACSPFRVMTADIPPVKAAAVDCNSNGTCDIPVYVYLGENDRCLAMPSVATVVVKQGKTPKLSWSIKEYPNQRPQYDYRFILKPATTPPVYGIGIVNNDPTKDFNAPDYDDDGHGGKDKSKFKWKDLNARSGLYSFDYVVNIERSLHNANDWFPCTPIDPKIINEGL